jgi:MFS family permease
VIAVLNLAALGAIEVGLPAIAYQRLGEGAVALGSAFAAWGIGSTVGSILAGTRPVPARFGWFMLATVALIGVGLAAAGLAPSLPVLILVMVALGVVEGLATTYLISWMQQRTDPGMQGRVMSLAMLASVGLEPVALAVAGAVAARDLGLLFWASAVAIEVTALAASLSRSVRRM